MVINDCYTKRILLLVLLWLLSLTTFSQNLDSYQNSARFGVNYGLYDGAFSMPSVYLEYSRSIKPWVGLTPRLMWGRFSRQSEDVSDNKKFFASILAISFTPMPNKVKSLKIHAGIVYHILERSYSYVQNPDTNPNSAIYNYYKEEGVGIFGSVSYDIINKNKFNGGLRVDFLTSLDEGYLNVDSSHLGIYFGIDF